MMIQTTNKQINNTAMLMLLLCMSGSEAPGGLHPDPNPNVTPSPLSHINPKKSRSLTGGHWGHKHAPDAACSSNLNPTNMAFPPVPGLESPNTSDDEQGHGNGHNLESGHAHGAGTASGSNSNHQPGEPVQPDAQHNSHSPSSNRSRPVSPVGRSPRNNTEVPPAPHEVPPAPHTPRKPKADSGNAQYFDIGSAVPSLANSPAPRRNMLASPAYSTTSTELRPGTPNEAPKYQSHRKGLSWTPKPLESSPELIPDAKSGSASSRNLSAMPILPGQPADTCTPLFTIQQEIQKITLQSLSDSHRRFPKGSNPDPQAVINGMQPAIELIRQSIKELECTEVTLKDQLIRMLNAWEAFEHVATQRSNATPEQGEHVYHDRLECRFGYFVMLCCDLRANLDPAIHTMLGQVLSAYRAAYGSALYERARVMTTPVGKRHMPLAKFSPSKNPNPQTIPEIIAYWQSRASKMDESNPNKDSIKCLIRSMQRLDSAMKLYASDPSETAQHSVDGQFLALLGVMIEELQKKSVETDQGPEPSRGPAGVAYRARQIDAARQAAAAKAKASSRPTSSNNPVVQAADIPQTDSTQQARSELSQASGGASLAEETDHTVEAQAVQSKALEATQPEAELVASPRRSRSRSSGGRPPLLPNSEKVSNNSPKANADESSQSRDRSAKATQEAPGSNSPTSSGQRARSEELSPKSAEQSAVGDIAEKKVQRSLSAASTQRLPGNPGIHILGALHGSRVSSQTTASGATPTLVSPASSSSSLPLPKDEPNHSGIPSRAASPVQATSPVREPVEDPQTPERKAEQVVNTPSVLDISPDSSPDDLSLLENTPQPEQTRTPPQALDFSGPTENADPQDIETENQDAVQVNPECYEDSTTRSNSPAGSGPQDMSLVGSSNSSDAGDPEGNTSFEEEHLQHIKEEEMKAARALLALYHGSENTEPKTDDGDANPERLPGDSTKRSDVDLQMPDPNQPQVNSENTPPAVPQLSFETKNGETSLNIPDDFPVLISDSKGKRHERFALLKDRLNSPFTVKPGTNTNNPLRWEARKRESQWTRSIWIVTCNTNTNTLEFAEEKIVLREIPDQIIPLNIHEILELNYNTPVATIKQAYRNLARIHHPDKNPDQIDLATKNFAKINAAFDLFSGRNRTTPGETEPPSADNGNPDPQSGAADSRVPPNASGSGSASSSDRNPAADEDANSQPGSRAQSSALSERSSSESESEKNYYEFLDVDPEADDATIASAFKDLAEAYQHIDHEQGVKFRLKIINAWKTLSNPQKRRDYDASLYGFYPDGTFFEDGPEIIVRPEPTPPEGFAPPPPPKAKPPVTPSGGGGTGGGGPGEPPVVAKPSPASPVLSEVVTEPDTRPITPAIELPSKKLAAPADDWYQRYITWRNKFFALLGRG